MARSTQLARVSLFTSLPEEELRAVADACRTRAFKRGEVLFHEEDPGNALFVLEVGQVKIVLISDDGDETILRVQGPGECIGELSLIDGAARSATAVALEPVEALALYRDDFLALIERRPSVSLAVMGGLAALVRRLSEQVQDLTTLDVPGRLAKKLLELAEQHGQPAPDGVRIPLRLTQQELAQMVGVTRVSINKQLGWFQERGMLTFERDGITIHAPDELRERIY